MSRASAGDELTVPLNSLSKSISAPDDLINDETDGAVDEATNSLAATVVSFVCTTVGAGILSLPYALTYAGWSGILLIVIVAAGCNYTARLLVACMFAIPGRRLRTYEDIGEAALGRIGRPLVAVFQLVTLFGVCCIFLILIGGNMRHITADVLPWINYHLWTLIFGVALISVSWLKAMKEIAALAFLGLFASVVVAAVVCVNGIVHIADGTAADDTTAFDVNGISVAINIVVFSFGGHSVIPSQVNEMIDAPTLYPRFTLVSYSLISSIYIAVAAAGYVAYGSQTADNVLNNIDTVGAAAVIAKIARAVIVVHICTAYPLPLYPIAKFFEAAFAIDQMTAAREATARIVMRTCIVVASIFVALVVPFFGDILSLVSALSIIVIAFVFPPIFYYRLHQQHTAASLALMLTVAVLGVGASVIGIYYALTGLITDIRACAGGPFADFFAENAAGC